MMAHARAWGWVISAWAVCATGVSVAQVPTDADDFFHPGTQPETLVDPLFPPSNCQTCHGFPNSGGSYTEASAPHVRWAASLMGQATRDPVFRAGLSIALQDAADSGELCLRCHAPIGWLNGNSDPADGSGLTEVDQNGVACHVCHRMVDPQYTDGVNPEQDLDVYARLDGIPVNPGNGGYIIDHEDRRRGPFDVEADWAELGGFFFHGEDVTLQSSFHKKAALCGTCHEVSNPAFMRQPDGTYTLLPVGDGEGHPTGDKYDMMPEQRTFSEWLMSEYALGPVDTDGRFGGNFDAVSTCQDCHMAAVTGQGCALEPPLRDDIPQHNFNGANTWVLRAVREQYFDSTTGLSERSVDDSIGRAMSMLERASDLSYWREGDTLITRITNYTGHKLPTGYPEGRRMWINVRFYDDNDMIISEHGAYDYDTAQLDEQSTKVYKARFGIGPDIATATGEAEGESFHLVLNNVRLFDNRIPPRGFQYDNFAAVQSEPIGYDYADGQNWDDTEFPIPEGTARFEVGVYYQTTSREYIEFLRDENVTNTKGQEAYDLWEQFGKSLPTEMDFADQSLHVPGDADGDFAVTLDDYFYFQICLSISGPGVEPFFTECTDLFDFDADMDVDMLDSANMTMLLAEAMQQ